MSDTLDLTRSGAATDQLTAELRLGGIRSDPIRMYPERQQAAITVIRAVNRGQLTPAELAPLLAVLDPDLVADDVVLAARPPSVEFTASVPSDESMVVTAVCPWLAANSIPHEYADWSTDEGPLGESDYGTGTYTHKFVSPGEHWMKLDLYVAGGHWSHRIANDVPNVTMPTVSALDPNTAEVGGAIVTMIVTGTGFDPGTTVIVFNGGDETTDYIDDTHVSTFVQPATASAGITVPVTVRNGTKIADPPLDFTFTEPVDAAS